jgi:methylmalonyl-CoA mutase N-terminal domain/subunit
MMLRFHTQTGGATLTAQQPDNNIIRTALQGLAAVLGGTQSLHTNSKDEALALPSEQAVQLALRTQQILAYETGVVDTVDPLAGSYFLEVTTDRLEDEACRLIDQVNRLGGAVAAIEAGFQQREIQESAYRLQVELESGERVVVGVNRFQSEEPPVEDILRVDPAVGRQQAERLARVRAQRDNARVEQRLSALERAAQSEDNLFPLILDAVEDYASIGEICDTLRGVWGEQRQALVF